MSITIKKENIPILLICAGFFLTPYAFRNSFFSDTANLNFLVWIGLLYGVIKGKFYMPYEQKSKNMSQFIVILFMLIMIILLFYVKGNGWTNIHRFKRVFVYVLPVLFVHWSFRSYDTGKAYLDLWFKFLKYICWLMMFFWGIDLVLGQAIQKGIVSLYSATSYSVNSGRFISIYGHPLETTMIFMAFLMWTIARKEEEGYSHHYIVNIIVAMMGAGICGSKSGLVLSVLLVLIYNFGFKNMKYMIGILFLVGVVYFLGGFDVAINRLTTSIEAGNVSTNRNFYLIELINNGMLSFDWLKGHTFIRDIEGMTSATEYPIIALSYMCGMLFTIMLYLSMFIIPGARILMSTHYKTFLCYLIFFLYINGNNGISSANDDMLFCAINIGLLFWLSVKSPKYLMRC